MTDDIGTPVLALHDWLSEEMEIREDPQHPIDGRLVDIQVIAGPHAAGRKGHLKRYLLSPIGPHAGASLLPDMQIRAAEEIRLVTELAKDASLPVRTNGEWN